MGKRKKKIINLTLDEKLLAQLTDRCNEIGIDRNGYLTKLIEYSLNNKIWEKKTGKVAFIPSVTVPSKSTKIYYLDDIEEMYSAILDDVFYGIADVVSDKDLVLIKALSQEERLNTDKAQWTADKLKEIKEMLRRRGTWFRRK